MSEQKLNNSQFWSMCLSAIVTVMESNNIFNIWEIGGYKVGENTHKWAQNCLKKLYGLESRENLVEWIDDLLQGGQSASMQDALVNLSRDPSHDNYRQRLVRDNADIIRRCGCAGWDMGRAATLIGWSKLAGYISEDEFWQFIEPVAKRAQQSYSSWREYADGYLLGLMYWSEGVEHKPTTDAINELFNNPKSPWLIMKWDMSLDFIIPKTNNSQTASNSQPTNNAQNNVNHSNDDPEIFPGQPISRLSDYVKLMKMAQSGQMMQAMTELGVDMMAYTSAMQRWGQKMAMDPSIAMKFSQQLNG